MRVAVGWVGAYAGVIDGGVTEGILGAGVVDGDGVDCNAIDEDVIGVEVVVVAGAPATAGFGTRFLKEDRCIGVS
jgi:hypothetical protein